MYKLTVFRALPLTLLIFALVLPIWVDTGLLPSCLGKETKTAAQIDKKATPQSDPEISDQPITVPLKKETNLSETQTHFLGNKFSEKYHLEGCFYARIARPENIFLFASCKEAIKSKYRPCNWCLPKWQKFVKGQILGYPKKSDADAKKSSSQWRSLNLWYNHFGRDLFKSADF